MAGRALLGVPQLPDTQHRCVILLVHEKVMSSGTSKNPGQRAVKRIALKLLEVVIVSLPIARTFCGRLLDQYLKTMGYFVIENTCMVMLLMGIDHLSGSVQPIMGPQHLFIDIEATSFFFTWVYRIGSLS